QEAGEKRGLVQSRRGQGNTGRRNVEAGCSRRGAGGAARGGGPAPGTRPAGGGAGPGERTSPKPKPGPPCPPCLSFPPRGLRQRSRGVSEGSGNDLPQGQAQPALALTHSFPAWPAETHDPGAAGGAPPPRWGTGRATRPGRLLPNCEPCQKRSWFTRGGTFP